MSRSVFAVFVAMPLYLLAQPASAQTAPSTSPAVLVGVLAGAQSVENVGALLGVDLSLRQSDHLTVFGEAAWLQDIITRRRLGTATAVANHLGQAQAGTATGQVKAPSLAMTIGAKFFFGAGSMRPYVTAQGGVARVTLQPTFTLSGVDVTESLSQYGVTLGEDLTGSTTKPAFGGGFGVATDRGIWTFDASIRFLSVQTKDQATNVLRLAVGLARRF